MNPSIIVVRSVAVALGSLLIALSLMGGFACGPAGEGGVGGLQDSAGPTGQARERVAELEISGMTCHGCASGVQETLSKLPGVVNAVVSPEDKTARVTLERGSAIGERELRAAIDAKGYKVTACTWDS
ncbi:MAG: heavy metal-associated domain-containing protein [Leptospirales bacterium]|jgi:copper chaperone CopZ